MRSDNNSNSSRPKRRFLRYLGIGIVGIAAVMFLGNLVWRYSGSDEWVLLQDREGVQLYSKKTPGYDLKTFRGLMKIDTTLDILVQIMQDPDACGDLCYDGKILSRESSQLLYYSFKADFPGLFRTRQWVFKGEFSQDPHTKAVLYKVTAAPDKAPMDDCCYRVTHMDNSWEFTPTDDGQLQIEFIVDTDDGGFLPDHLINVMTAEFMHPALYGLHELSKKEKYQDANFDFIEKVQAVAKEDTVR